MGRSGGEGGQQLLARLLARVARLGADAAVLHVAGVPLALRAARSTRLHAGLHLRAQDAPVGLRHA